GRRPPPAAGTARSERRPRDAACRAPRDPAGAPPHAHGGRGRDALRPVAPLRRHHRRPPPRQRPRTERRPAHGADPRDPGTV
ncbi:MAG: hypothetical protein AVDCRST_MAG68-4488, partial [uncultured Gemmatimonadetes bacterium]